MINREDMYRVTKLINAGYIGGYNDRILFNALILFNNEETNIILERDSKKQNATWEIITDLNLSKKEKEGIIKIISQDMPIFLADKPPKIYNAEIKIFITEQRKEEIFNHLMDYVFEHCSDDKEVYNTLTNIIGLNDEEIEELGIVFDEQEDELDMEIE